MQNLVLPEVLDVVKIGAIIFSLGHLLLGFKLYLDMSKMNRELKTKNSFFFTFFANFYIVVLTLVLAIFILA